MKMHSRKLSNSAKLDNALVISKLSSGVIFEMIHTKKTRWQIVVISGIPFEYRMVSIAMISYAAGAFAEGLRNQFHDETLTLWDDIGYKYNREISGNWDIAIEFIKSVMTTLTPTPIDGNNMDLTPFAKMVSQAICEFIPS